MADDPTATLIRNERMKLGATLFNNIAVALVVTGVIVPVVATAYQMSVPHGRFWLAYIVLWLMGAVANHQIGRNFLGRLKL